MVVGVISEEQAAGDSGEKVCEEEPVELKLFRRFLRFFVVVFRFFCGFRGFGFGGGGRV